MHYTDNLFIMIIDKNSGPKKHKLKMDEFATSEWHSGFWRLPHGIAALQTLSPGAKLLYSTLFVLASKHNAAYASKEYLQACLGHPSLKTLYLWQKQLENEGLIRVLQKGRGQTNNYYLLRHPALGNSEVGEFEPGPRPLYRNRQHGTQTIVTPDEGLYIYNDVLSDWYKASCRGELVEFPKPGIKIPKKQRKEMELEWQQRYADAIISGEAIVTELPDYDCSQTTNDNESTTESATVTNSGTHLDYDAVFSDSSNKDSAASTLSDEPSVMSLPSGHLVHGPSSRQLYEAAMDRRAASKSHTRQQ